MCSPLPGGSPSLTSSVSLVEDAEALDIYDIPQNPFQVTLRGVDAAVAALSNSQWEKIKNDSYWSKGSFKLSLEYDNRGIK